MTNGVTAFNSRCHGYIVKSVDSGTVVTIIPDQFTDEDSKQRAIDFINDNILLRRCEIFFEEDLTDFALRLDEVAEELYRKKSNPDAN